MPYKPKAIPVDEIREALEYRDGALFWKIKPSAKVYVGDRAGREEKSLYRTVWWKGSKYLEHRLIWTMFNGDTDLIVDHKS